MRPLSRAVKRSNRMVVKTLPAKIRAILKKYGSDAHLYTFGPGVPILGPELVVNGDFSNGATGWLLNSSGGVASIANGELTLGSTAGSYVSATVQSGDNPGRTYRLQVDVRSISGSIGFVTNGEALVSPDLVVGTNTFFYTATGVNSYGLKRKSGVSLGVFDNYSCREVLGYSNTYSGFVAGNYIDSAGSIQAAVDQPIGLVLDAAGSLGVELAPSPTATVGWAGINGPVSSDGTALTIANSGASEAYATFGGAVAGKSYRVEVEISATGGGQGNFSSGAGATRYALSGVGKYSFIVVATSSGWFAVSTNSATAGHSASIKRISVREVTGIHASQSTPGYKPTLRKGIVNLLSNSNPTWTLVKGSTGTGVITSGQADPYGGNAAQRLQLAANSDYSLVQTSITSVTGAHSGAIVAKSNTGSNQNVTIWTDNQTPVAVTLTPEWTTVAAGQNVSNAAHFKIMPAGGSADITVARIGLFQGALTAQQIIAAGGIPLTTTAPASSGAGPFHLELVNDDFMLLGSVPFQQADDHCVVVCASPNAVLAGFDQDVFAIRGATSTPICALIRFASDGFIKALYRDDSGLFVVLVGPAYVAGGKYAIAVRKVGNVRTLWVNGVLAASDTTALGATTLSSAAIGCSYYGGIFTALTGRVFSVSPTKGAMSDADVVTESKFAAQIAGATL